MDTREQQWDKFKAREGQYLTRGPDKSGDTALHRAAWGGYEHVVEDLITQGHDINAKNAFGETVMQKAIQPVHFPESDPRAIQQTLIDAGAKLEPELLRTAAMTGDGEMCKFLVKEGGIDVNSRFHGGDTALHGAAKLGQGEAVEGLLSVGADARLQNDFKQTPRSVAIGSAATQALENHERVLDRPKEINIPDPKSALERVRSAPAQEPKLAKGRSL